MQGLSAVLQQVSHQRAGFDRLRAQLHIVQAVLTDQLHKIIRHRAQQLTQCALATGCGAQIHAVDALLIQRGHQVQDFFADQPVPFR